MKGPVDDIVTKMLENMSVEELYRYIKLLAVRQIIDKQPNSLLTIGAALTAVETTPGGMFTVTIQFALVNQPSGEELLQEFLNKPVLLIL